jgi:surface antigen
MDGEDWRRAKSALDTALDPQGNGAQVTWDNPKSGAKGTFVPLAQPYPKDDGICRAFTARVDVQGRGSNVLRSSACRRNGGEWIVGKVTPLGSGPNRSPHPLRNLAERDTSTHLN